MNVRVMEVSSGKSGRAEPAPLVMTESRAGAPGNRTRRARQVREFDLQRQLGSSNRRDRVAQAILGNAWPQMIRVGYDEALRRELCQTRVHVEEGQILGGSDFIWFTSSTQGRLFRVRIVSQETKRSTGSGRNLLDELPSIRLESIRSATSPTGHLLVDYRVIR
jgi:hypothetical protein